MALIQPPPLSRRPLPNWAKALTGLFLVDLPMAVSAMIMVYPKVRARAI